VVVTQAAILGRFALAYTIKRRKTTVATSISETTINISSKLRRRFLSLGRHVMNGKRLVNLASGRKKTPQQTATTSTSSTWSITV